MQYKKSFRIFKLKYLKRNVGLIMPEIITLDYSFFIIKTTATMAEIIRHNFVQK